MDVDEKNRHARVCAAAAPARPTTSRAHRPSAPPRSGKFAADRPRSSGPGCSFPHFSQRRTVSRGACICSSASRSRRRFPTAAAAPPAPALPIARWRTCSIVAAPFGRPTAISTQQAAHFSTQTPTAYDNVALGLIYNGVSSRSLRHPSAADRDFHSVGGVLRHADARGGFRPANAARTPPHFFPTCDAQEANLFI